MTKTTLYIQQDRLYFCGDHMYELVSVKRKWFQFWKPKSWLEKRQLSFEPKTFEFAEIGDPNKW